MGALIIVLLAVIASIVCIVVCAREIVKDIRCWIEIFKSTKNDEDLEDEEAKCTIICFKKPERGQKAVCDL